MSLTEAQLERAQHFAKVIRDVGKITYVDDLDTLALFEQIPRDLRPAWIEEIRKLVPDLIKGFSK